MAIDDNNYQRSAAAAVQDDPDDVFLLGKLSDACEEYGEAVPHLLEFLRGGHVPADAMGAVRAELAAILDSFTATYLVLNKILPATLLPLLKVVQDPVVEPDARLNALDELRRAVRQIENAQLRQRIESELQTLEQTLPAEFGPLLQVRNGEAILARYADAPPEERNVLWNELMDIFHCLTRDGPHYQRLFTGIIAVVPIFELNVALENLYQLNRSHHRASREQRLEQCQRIEEIMMRAAPNQLQRSRALQAIWETQRKVLEEALSDLQKLTTSIHSFGANLGQIRLACDEVERLCKLDRGATPDPRPMQIVRQVRSRFGLR